MAGSWFAGIKAIYKHQCPSKAPCISEFSLFKAFYIKKIIFSVEQLQCEVRAAGLDSKGLREVGGPAALSALYRAGSLCEGSQASGAAGRTWR